MAKEIFFEKRGSGPLLILIHGFPMNRHVWDKLVPDLEKEFTVVTPDLPGFGNSELDSEFFTLEEIASTLNSWVLKNNFQDAVLIGHSLGGYVVLAMQKSAPDFYRGLGLLHSTAYEDSEEKKESRTKVLKFVDDNGVLAFTSNFIEPLFANSSHPDIPFVRAITVQSSKEAVKGYTKAMRDRPDTTALLAKISKPVLIIGGDSDKGISVPSLQEQARLSPRIKLHILPGTAHMGMFEKRAEVGQIIRGFLRSFVQ